MVKDTIYGVVKTGCTCLFLTAGLLTVPVANAEKPGKRPPTTIVNPFDIPTMELVPEVPEQPASPAPNPALHDPPRPGDGQANWNCDYPYAGCLLGSRPDAEERELLRRILAVRGDLVKIHNSITAVKNEITNLSFVLNVNPDIPEEEKKRLQQQIEALLAQLDGLRMQENEKQQQLRELLIEAERKLYGRGNVTPASGDYIKNKCQKAFSLCVDLWKAISSR